MGFGNCWELVGERAKEKEKVTKDCDRSACLHVPCSRWEEIALVMVVKISKCVCGHLSTQGVYHHRNSIITKNTTYAHFLRRSQLSSLKGDVKHQQQHLQQHRSNVRPRQSAQGDNGQTDGWTDRTRSAISPHWLPIEKGKAGRQAKVVQACVGYHNRQQKWRGKR